MKRIFALLLAVIMSFGVLAACGEEEPPPPPADPGAGTGEAGTGGTETTGEGYIDRKALAEAYGLPWDPEMESWESVELTYFSRNSGNTPAETNPHIQIIEQITNTKIIFNMLSGGDLETAMGNMLASGDLDDITFFGGEVDPAINSGHLIPLEDLVEEYAPKLREHFDPWWEMMRFEDGHIYTLDIWSTYKGNPETYWANQTAIWIQNSVLDHFGYPPKDLDEYFEMLKEYADIYQQHDGVDIIPFLIHNGNGNCGFALANGGFFLGGNANWGGAVNADGNDPGAEISPDVKARWTGDFQYKWWKKLNEEFRAGTFTEEVFTYDDDMYQAKIATGAVLGLADQFWHFETPVYALEAEQRHERSYMPLALTFDGAEPNYLDQRDPITSFTGSNGVNISTANKNPVRTIQYMNYLIDEDVQRFLYWGEENVHYFYNNNGDIERYPEAREQQKDSQWNNDNLGRFLLNAFPKIQGEYPISGDPASTEQSLAEYKAGLHDYTIALYDKLGIDRQVAFYGEIKPRPIYYPYWSFSPRDGTPAGDVNTELNNANKAIALMVVATSEADFEKQYADYIKEIEAIDTAPLEEFFAGRAQAKADAFNR